jgi:hypothetical protein
VGKKNAQKRFSTSHAKNIFSTLENNKSTSLHSMDNIARIFQEEVQPTIETSRDY